MVLVDSNVLIDIASDDPQWSSWSTIQMELAARNGPLLINDVIYAESSARYRQIADYQSFLSRSGLLCVPMPAEALFLAGKTFAEYRRVRGTKIGVLPGFFYRGACRRQRACAPDAGCPALPGLFSRHRSHHAAEQPAMTRSEPISIHQK